MTALRIAYVGLPLGALALASSGFAPVSICLGHTDAPGARRVRRQLSKTALLLGRPNLEDPGVVRVLASEQPDLLLSWFWPKRIPPAVLALAPRGAYGVHPSLLPRWRGPDPYFWAIAAGDAETGVTLHVLDPEYDTGGIVEQRTVTIDPHENAWSLARRLDRPGLELLVAAARKLARGDVFTPHGQDPARVTLAPRPSDEDLTIDWSQPAQEIVRRVRAAAPYPGATAEIGATTVEIIAARSLQTELPRALRPAEAVRVGAEIAVQTGQGAVVLERVRDETGQVRAGPAIAALLPGTVSALPSASGRASGKNST